MDILIVFLITLVGVLLVKLLTRSKEATITNVRCSGPHIWYSMLNEKEEFLGLICLDCGFVAGSQ